jgi:hypothetical protein
MVEPSGVDSCLPKILLVPAETANIDLFLARIKALGCLTENLVWHFDTKYYTASVKVELLKTADNQEVEIENVESIIFLVRDASLTSNFKEKVKNLMDEY